MNFPQEYLDELQRVTRISSILGKYVTWDKKKTRASQGDYWACCPFHSEKTPSFHATDQKGTYYCFSCHAKGNVFTFLQENRGLSFVEAVKFLAQEANMPLPKLTGQEEKQAQRYSELYQMNRLAAVFFQDKLFSKEGQSALDYLLNRGLKQETIREFGLGFAPNGNQLFQHLRVINSSDDILVDSGLAKRRENGSGVYPTFRNRIMFPIKNQGGKEIAFGGRAMDPEHPAKYLNSPATDIFDKGSILYNLHSALSHRDKNDPNLVVVEGYLDVIALCEAGFHCTVAPMGTALTEQQLEILWRHASRPTFVMDGDAAGFRAASRISDLALPLLRDARGARFCSLPQDVDPDDYVRKYGRETFSKLLDSAQELWEFLWFIETKWLAETYGPSSLSDHRIQDKLNANLKVKLKAIEDKNQWYLYTRRLRDRFYKTFFSRQQPGQLDDISGRHAQELRNQISEIITKVDKSPFYLAEALIVGILVKNLELVSAFTEQLEGYDFAVESFEAIRSELLFSSVSSNKSVPNASQEFIEKSDHGQELKEVLGLEALTVYKEFSGKASISEKTALLKEAFKILQEIRMCDNLSSDVISSFSDDNNESIFEALKRNKIRQSRNSAGTNEGTVNQPGDLDPHVSMLEQYMAEGVHDESGKIAGIHKSNSPKGVAHKVPEDELRELEKLVPS